MILNFYPKIYWNNMYQPLLVNFYGLVEKKLIFLDHFIISRLIFLPFYMLFHVMPSRVLSTKASVQVSFNWHNLAASHLNWAPKSQIQHIQKIVLSSIIQQFIAYTILCPKKSLSGHTKLGSHVTSTEHPRAKYRISRKLFFQA